MKNEFRDQIMIKTVPFENRFSFDKVTTTAKIG